MASIMALCSVVGASSAVMYWNRDPIKYNISLFTKMALNKYDDKLSPWWSKINDDIYIGAVPFDGQEKEIIKQIGTDGHVLSIMRKFVNNYTVVKNREKSEISLEKSEKNGVFYR